MNNQLVPVDENVYPNLYVTPFSEREALLCEAMLWVREGYQYPYGIGNLDVFLLTLVEAAHQMWLSREGVRVEVKRLETKCSLLLDEISMLRNTGR